MPVFSSVDQVLAPHGEYFSFSMNQFFTMDLLYIYDVRSIAKSIS